MKIKLLTFIILFTTVTFCTGKALAQELQRSITLSPPGVQLKLDPGGHGEGVLKVINDGDSPLDFNTSTQDFIVKDDQGTPDILPPDTLSNKYSAASWIAIYPQTFTIPAHSKTELNYYIQVPGDARPGGHYAAAMYTPTNTIGVKGTGASVNTSVGTLFYITVSGPVTIQAQVSQFLSKFLWDFGPVTFNTKILNQSDLHITPAGTVTLTNMLGGTTDKKSLDTHNIFPGVSRAYQTTLGKSFMLGIYKATFNATYGPNKNTLVASTSVLVFPWKIAVFIILLVVALIIGRKYWKKRTTAEENQTQTPQV